MPLIDYTARTVLLRFALLGPTGAGRRTTLRGLHGLHLSASKEDLEVRPIGPDQRHGFVFVPAGTDSLDGYHLQAEIFTLIGESAGDIVRERLLSDLDAVLFVADSRQGKLEANAACLRAAGAQAILAEVPVVFFYNQRDLPESTPVAQMEAVLNPLGAPSFGGSAATGAGLAPLLEALLQVTFASRR